MPYLADTVALVRHLSKHPNLGQQARRILQQADRGEDTIFISAISLMEILYLSQAKRITINLLEMTTFITNSTNYILAPVDAHMVLSAATIDDVPELHDRILVGTAKYLRVPILTCDHVIVQSRHVQTIWT